MFLDSFFERGKQNLFSEPLDGMPSFCITISDDPCALF
jgi:hypothetical protein